MKILEAISGEIIENNILLLNQVKHGVKFIITKTKFEYKTTQSN